MGPAQGILQDMIQSERHDESMLLVQRNDLESAQIGGIKVFLFKTQPLANNPVDGCGYVPMID